MPALIEVNDMFVSYAAHCAKPVLSGVTLCVPVGSVIALIGTTGSGKSTLLRTIAGVQTPDSGSIKIAGIELVGSSEAMRRGLRREHLSFLSDRCPLMPELTLAENIGLPLRIRGLQRRVIRQAVERVMQELGLSELQHRIPTEVSSGQRRLAGVARALAADLPIIILDEPTTGLDTKHRDQVAAIVLSHCRRENQTVLFSTHYLPDAVIAGETWVLHEGRICYRVEATPDNASYLDSIWDRFAQVSTQASALFR